MNKRNLLIAILFFMSIGFMLIFCLLADFHPILRTIALVFICIYFIYVFFVIFLCIYEKRKMGKSFKKIGDDIDLQILYCQKVIQKYFIYSCVINCRLKLGICYLMKDEFDLASQQLKEFDLKNRFQFSYYPNYILAVMQNDISKMNAFFEKLMKCTKPVFQTQKQIAIQIKEMIEKEEYNEEVYITTKYPCIKKLCLKYKK